MRFLIDITDSNFKLLKSISVEAESAEEAQDALEDTDIPTDAAVWWVQAIDSTERHSGQF